MKLSKLLCAGMLALLTSCATVPAKPKVVAPQNCGMASWYALHGNRTANGERMNMHGMTAAHKKLAFNTKVEVTNPKNGKSVVVRINDRGPFTGGRVLDLSKGSAAKIGIVGAGVGKVCYRVVK